MGVRLMVSIWPIMTGGCPDQSELLGRNLMLGNQSTYNAWLPEARECYWDQANRGLFSQGVDAWWCECTEPFEADWAGAVKPQPHGRLAINTEASKRYLDAGQINAYSLLHSQGIYEGQRSTASAKRVVNLTRSSYAGQHRYGTITWNGDICGTWEMLRRCIPEGLNFCASGEPYWTVDIGGFFIDNDPTPVVLAGRLLGGLPGAYRHERSRARRERHGLQRSRLLGALYAMGSVRRIPSHVSLARNGCRTRDLALW